MDALEELRGRLAEVCDLSAIAMLAGWDQQVMMPAQGGQARAEQLSSLARVIHERATDPALGDLLGALADADLGDVDADVVRLALRDYERAQRVPADLAAELARASTEGHERWVAARAQDDFAAFAPALERNVQLAREHGRCLAGEDETPYEALLAEYDFGLRTDRLRVLFGELAERLPPLVHAASEAGPRPWPEIPEAAQREAVARTLMRLGVEETSWRVDVAPHPFSAFIGTGDARITTRYQDGGAESLLSSLHEYGHALYDRQIDGALRRTPAGQGTSMSVHESQSKLWENHVARSAGFCRVMAADLDASGCAIGAPALHRAITAVEPSLIRVAADPVSYPLHIVLRFELELALIEGELEVGELPDAWNAAMRALVGVEPPSDALGCLQDVHWASGAFGYFPSYALGCLIAAQLWQTLERDLGDQEERLARGETAQIADWLGERVHRHGRRLDTLELVERATGARLETSAFMGYAQRIAEGRRDLPV